MFLVKLLVVLSGLQLLQLENFWVLQKSERHSLSAGTGTPEVELRFSF